MTEAPPALPADAALADAVLTWAKVRLAELRDGGSLWPGNAANFAALIELAERRHPAPPLGDAALAERLEAMRTAVEAAAAGLRANPYACGSDPRADELERCLATLRAHARSTP